MLPQSRELARPSLSFRTTCKFRTSKQMIQSEMPIVSCANRPSMRWLFTFVLVALAAAAVPAFAQQKAEEPSRSQGYVEDWSSHHVVFSNPGSEPDVRDRDEHDKWLRIVNDERYMMQQRRRSAPRRWGDGGTMRLRSSATGACCSEPRPQPAPRIRLRQHRLPAPR